MEGLLLQPWICLTAHSSIASLTQDESGWLDLPAYQNLIIWVLCRGVRGGVDIRLHFETAPARDESLFVGVDAVVLAASTTPTVRKPADKPARWLRWKLAPDTTPGVEWGATFQVHCSLNPIRGVRF